MSPLDLSGISLANCKITLPELSILAEIVTDGLRLQAFYDSKASRATVSLDLSGEEKTNAQAEARMSKLAEDFRGIDLAGEDQQPDGAEWLLTRGQKGWGMGAAPSARKAGRGQREQEATKR